MLLLAIETSTRLGAVALVHDRDGVVAERRFALSVAHSESLLPGVASLLEEAGLTLQGLTGLAVAIGPGSFTGLRVALSTAKGLALATGLPIYPVSTLEALAWPLRFSALPVCPVLHARKNEVFAACYRPHLGDLEILIPESALAPDELIARISEPTLFLGDGSLKYRDRIFSTLGDGRVYFAPTTLCTPGAVSVAELAFHRYKDNAPPNPASLAPAYLRPCEAEVRWQERTSGSSR